MVFTSAKSAQLSPVTSWELITLLPHSKGNLWLVSLFYHPPTKALPKQLVTQKKAQRLNIKRQGSPAPRPVPLLLELSGDTSDHCPHSGFCKAFDGLFSFLFVLFSLHKWKNASGQAAHIWSSRLHTGMSPGSQPVPCPFLGKTP